MSWWVSCLKHPNQGDTQTHSGWTKSNLHHLEQMKACKPWDQLPNRCEMEFVTPHCIIGGSVLCQVISQSKPRLVACLFEARKVDDT